MENNNLLWYQKPTTIVLFLIFFFPIGLYLMWSNNLWTKQIRLTISIVIALILIFRLSSNKPTACDCANLYNNSPLDNTYTPRQLDDGTFSSDVDKYVEKAKRCAEIYGDLTDYEKEIVRSTTEMSMIPKLHQAIENAKKECAKNKTFSQEQLNSACDCWNQSYRKSGMEYDRMTPEQQKIRNNCFKLFGDEESMKVACEER